MKRDSSGSMGHWGASGTRYFGAGLCSTCRSAARRSWSDNASVSRGDGLRTDDLRTTGPGPRLGLCGRSRVVSSVRAACRHAQLEGGKEGRGDGSAVLLVMSACMYGVATAATRPPTSHTREARRRKTRVGGAEHGQPRHGYSHSRSSSSSSQVRCAGGEGEGRGRGLCGVVCTVVWALWARDWACTWAWRGGDGASRALSLSAGQDRAQQHRDQTDPKRTRCCCCCSPAPLPAPSVATVRNLLLRRTGKRLVCCAVLCGAVCCLFRAARSSPGPAAAAVLWSKRIHACLLPLPVPTHTLARSSSLATHAASQPRSLPSQLLSPNWPSPHATDRQSAR